MTATAPAVAESPRPLRADAARNRELILATAKRLFAERGIEVTLNDIAHEAGVGVGTVYRRFPDKDALVEAMVQAKFENLHNLARDAAQQPTPREALRYYLLGAIELRARDKALAHVIVRGAMSSPAVMREREAMTQEVTAIVERAREACVVRDGFSASDVPALSSMVGVVADSTREVDPDGWRRYAQLLVDAVVAPDVELPLCGRPIASTAIDRALGRAQR